MAPWIVCRSVRPRPVPRRARAAISRLPSTAIGRLLRSWTTPPMSPPTAFWLKKVQLGSLQRLQRLTFLGMSPVALAKPRSSCHPSLRDVADLTNRPATAVRNVRRWNLLCSKSLPTHLRPREASLGGHAMTIPVSTHVAHESAPLTAAYNKVSWGSSPASQLRLPPGVSVVRLERNERSSSRRP